jgi:alkanesulfonate monooxygenase SsuD/methylene tetrahydromethanopterin reductase-like flavin-dependent oxidoreductase (luciferase family)
MFNVDHGESRAIFQEALEIVLDGLATGTVSHEGHYYAFKNVSLPLRPLQQPYPPLWYPTSNASSIPWIAAQGCSLLLSATTPSWTQTADLITQYKEQLAAHRGDPDRLNAHVAKPLYGFSRHVYVGETDAEAWDTAQIAFEEFESNYTTRPGRRAGDHYAERPDFRGAVEQGRWLVGSSATVRDRLKEYVDLVGGNYFVGVFAFGNLHTEQILGSIRRFAEQVMPALATSAVVV